MQDYEQNPNTGVSGNVNSTPAAPQPAPAGPRRMSGMAIAAFILSLTFIAAPVGLILGIVDLARKDPNRRHGLAIPAVIIGGIASLILIIAIAAGGKSDKEEQKSDSARPGTEERADSEDTKKDSEQTEEQASDTAEDKTEPDSAEDTDEPSSESPSESADDGPDEESDEETDPAEEDKLPKNPEKVYVGDVFTDGSVKYTYLSSGEFQSDNQFLQPDEGMKYAAIRVFAENISKSSRSVSYFDFECYADGYAMEQFYGGEDDFTATLSPGRATGGLIIFSVPEDAEEIEFEMETDIFSETKICFVYEGDKDSGIMPDVDGKPTPDAVAAGGTAETKTLRISYLSCEDYDSSNVFIQPSEGNHLIILGFEFENIGSDDEYVSSLDFDCYADGISCRQRYAAGDEELSATISAGRKTKGQLVFEVPDDAEVIEVEYLDDIWTDKYIVFTCK